MKSFNIFKRPVKVVVRESVRYITTEPSEGKGFVDTEKAVAKLQAEYNKIAIAVEPYIGGTTNRDFVRHQIGRMDGIVTAVSIITNTDSIIVGFQMDKAASENRVAVLAAA